MLLFVFLVLSFFLGLHTCFAHLHFRLPWKLSFRLHLLYSLLYNSDWLLRFASVGYCVADGCSLLLLISCACCLLRLPSIRIMATTVPRQFWDFLAIVDGDVERSETFLRTCAGAFLNNSVTDELDLIGFEVSERVKRYRSHLELRQNESKSI